VKIGPKPPGTYKSIADAVKADPEAVLDFLKHKDNIFFLILKLTMIFLHLFANILELIDKIIMKT
jgi:hypothetical protein